MIKKFDDGIGVTEALVKLLEQKPQMFDEVADGIAHYMKEHRRAKADCDDGPSRAAGFHRAMDQLIDDARQGQEISCTKGCSHCCHIEVHITPDEAELLIRYAAHIGLDIDWARVEHQAKVDRWRQLDYKARRCAFLADDGTCGVYLHRPMNCRKYMVASPAERCNSLKYPAGQTMLMTANRAEIMASALFSACGSDTMPKMLIKTKGVPNDRK